MVKNPQLSYCIEKWYWIVHEKHSLDRADIERVKILEKISKDGASLYKYENEYESTDLVSKDQIFETKREAQAYFDKQKTKKTNDLKNKINSISDIIKYAIYDAQSSKDLSKREIEIILLDRAKELDLIKE